MNKDYIGERILSDVFSIGVTYIKGVLRNKLAQKSRCLTSKELLDNIESRVLDLEIKGAKGDACTDLEKKAKEKDMEIKNKVSANLGLFDVKPTRTISLSSGDGASETHYVCGKIIKAGDRLVLVSPPGSGKSAWATQIGICLTEGRDPEFIQNGTCARAPKVVEYYDAELDSDDRTERYGNYSTSPLFHLHDHCKYRTFYYLLDEINERTSTITSDAAVIIDNVFAVMPGLSAEDARTFLDGLDIIQYRLLEKGIRLTIILVTHTTKDVEGAPKLKDVAGSAHFARFAKSVMSLYVRKDKKTVLVTNKRRYAGDKNALVMQLSSCRYLHFEYVGIDSVETDPFVDDVQATEDSESGEVSTEQFPHEKKIEMWKMNKQQSMSSRKIAEYFNGKSIPISHTSVMKFIKEVDMEMGS